jgi:hypothetical protein
VQRLEADKEEARRVRLQRELNRELAMMIALAMAGRDLPALDGENEDDGEEFVETVWEGGA